MNSRQFALIVPLWNEEKNIDSLVGSIVSSGLVESCLSEVIFVNNGSSDRTGALINKAAARYSWLKPVHLNQNKNYGGGVYHGICQTNAAIVAYIPGDLQISIEDLKRIWTAFQVNLAKHSGMPLFVKGNRTVRKDGWNTRLVSKAYTLLANIFLGLNIKDVNGLPKMFHRRLIQLLPEEKFNTFVFDVQLIYTARLNHWKIEEIPVTFHARREGVSSWSGKRFQTYMTTIRHLVRCKYLSYPKSN